MNQAMQCVHYELEVEFNAPVESVWAALIQETNSWWLPDFHMVAEDSTVAFDLSPGGQGLIEHRSDGSFLQWYAVQAYLPEQRTLYLVGSLAADFGGPSTSHLRLKLEAADGGCKLLVQDSHIGDVDENTARSLQVGWQQLFGDGLKSHVERHGSN